jgi:hypothetical protein
MKAKAQLSPHDRKFFELVSRAAFSNPFSDARIELDLKIAGGSQDVSSKERVPRMYHVVAEKVRNLEAEDKADVRLYAEKDRYTIQSVFLFDVFYRFIEDFDRLILDQIKVGDRSCPVPFARSAISLMIQRGFTATEARWFFAMFYQLRRAFYFIDRTLVGSGPSMRQLRLHLWNDVFTHDILWYGRYLWNRMEDFSTLLLGETGTGKGTAAAAIGRSGFIPYDEKKGCFAESFTRSFISINLSQYPETLIESELFGHKKGAFTGAIDHHEGLFARCSPYGSIFLDEIGDLSIPVQIKLLKVLEERTFSPVGSHEKGRFSGRIIAATNKPVDELRHKGLFRDDFFYRLCSDIITVPPLRQRLQENPRELDEILNHLIFRMIGETSQELARMVQSVIDTDLGKYYTWPGNVRELEQAVRRILLTRHYRGEVIMSDLRTQLFSGIATGSLDAHNVLTTYCTLLYEQFGTYEEVARRTKLDRRTVKKYIWSGIKSEMVLDDKE